MPDPIPSSCFSPALTFNFDDELSLANESEPAAAAGTPNACLRFEADSEAAASSAASSAGSALAQRFSSNDQTAFVAASPAPSTSASAAASPGVLTVRPDQVDLQAGIPRLQGHATLGGVRLTAGIDILNANAHLGSRNGDGSRGENIGAGASLLGGELNIDYRGWSLTLGVAASLGGSISSGDSRDVDTDGVPERCFAMSLGPFTLGECDEL